MNKILIATRNNDKFKIVRKLLCTFFLDKYDFYNLNDLNVEIIDKKESGDLINRSFQKAKNAFDTINDIDFDYIIGVDDGMKIRGKIIENVKDYISPIINDEMLSKDEIVYIVRAYTFFNKNGETYSFLTEIPFKYKKLTYRLDIKKDSYPLSYVLMPLNSSKTVVEQSVEESNIYYYNYSKEGFAEVKEYFNDK